MKQMEYRIRIITDKPIDTVFLTDGMLKIPGVQDAEVTNYRVIPTPKEKKS